MRNKFFSMIIVLNSILVIFSTELWALNNFATENYSPNSPLTEIFSCPVNPNYALVIAQKELAGLKQDYIQVMKFRYGIVKTYPLSHYTMKFDDATANGTVLTLNMNDSKAGTLMVHIRKIGPRMFEGTYNIQLKLPEFSKLNTVGDQVGSCYRL